jgi:predicted ATPase/transcriptional regulator with XRE-family HTH domain
MDTFGEWLRQQRDARKLTRDDFANRVGCSVAMLRKIEDDERRPSKQIAELIANTLDIPTAERETFIRVARGELGTDRLTRVSNLTQQPGISSSRAIPQNNLPVFPTPLIGREPEMEHLKQLLCNPQCRMVTLVGPGGMGKTRLAIEAATQLQNDFTDGLYFVPLAPVNSARFLVPVIADSIGFSFQSATSTDPKTQLLNYLREKQMLLLLDNIEHLLKEPEIEFMAELLEHAPQVKLLVTSREPVNLQSEWVFEVQGLPLPENENMQGTSIELFLQRARRAHVSFNATTNDYPAILHICQLVDGMPLGIELAAAWVRTLTCDEIAHEIERGLDFLSTSARDLPARHRSMRAVFDHSWKLLSVEEQLVLARFSIFQGGFSRDAAEQIADATISVLSNLVTKSLIRRSGEGRYDLHELVRQYAVERLADQPKVRKEAIEHHGRYYMKYFGDQDSRLRGTEQRRAIEELSVELENFRAAWDWSIAHHEFALIESTLRAFAAFFDARGWLRDDVDLLDRAKAAVEKAPPKRSNQVALAHILVNEGLYSFRLSRIEQARSALTRSIAILRPLNEPRVLVEAVSFLGIVSVLMGRFKEALGHFYEGLEIARATNNKWFEALDLTEIAISEIMTGISKNPTEQLQTALNAWREISDPRFTAFGLLALSLGMNKLQKYPEARAALEESISINESVGDRWGLGTAYRGLALVEQEQGRHEEAIEAFQKSRSILNDLGARWDEARVLGDMGRSIVALGKITDAENTWRMSIQIASEVKGTSLVLESILGFANVRAKQGNSELAYELLLVVLNHPATVQETRERAAKLSAELERRLTMQEVNSIQARIEKRDFDALVAEILNPV